MWPLSVGYKKFSQAYEKKSWGKGNFSFYATTRKISWEYRGICNFRFFLKLRSFNYMCDLTFICRIRLMYHLFPNIPITYNTMVHL